MIGTGGYIALVIIGIVITAGVGQILLRSGEPFLRDVFQKEDSAHSINLLLSVLFHILTLGVLAVISIVDYPDPDEAGIPQTIVFKIGITLLIVGIAYGISMLVLLRIRERRRQAAVSAQISEKLAEQRQGRAPGRIRRGESDSSDSSKEEAPD